MLIENKTYCPPVADVYELKPEGMICASEVTTSTPEGFYWDDDYED